MNVLKVYFIELSLTCPGLIVPGHHAIVGSLIPPSNVVSLPHKKGSLDPPHIMDKNIHIILFSYIIIYSNPYLFL